MLNALELFQCYLDSIQNPHAAAALFADDGALEIPYLESLDTTSRVQGPSQIEAFIGSLLAKVPDFRFRHIRFLIETPDQVFAEYEVEAVVSTTGRVYRQAYAGRLVAKAGKIQLLRESLDTLAAQRAFTPREKV
jgi:ketosteroid isomerase-like protein